MQTQVLRMLLVYSDIQAKRYVSAVDEMQTSENKDYETIY